MARQFQVPPLNIRCVLLTGGKMTNIHLKKHRDVLVLYVLNMSY